VSLLKLGLTAVALALLLWGRHVWNKTKDARTPRPTIERLQLVEVSPTRGVQVFRRSSGSYGYYLVTWSEVGACWAHPMTHIGPGSAYDTAERAEEYGRAEAAAV